MEGAASRSGTRRYIPRRPRPVHPPPLTLEKPLTFLHRLAKSIAEDVEFDLSEREITCLKSLERGRQATRNIDRHFVAGAHIYQATVMDAWPAEIEKIPAEQFRRQYFDRWVRALVIKLAFPGVMTTYPMDLPQGVEHAVIGESANITLRAVADYSMFDDKSVIRLDVLASWAED